MGSVPGKAQRVIGRYALYEPLSSGGMATVHIARLQGPVGFARTVAIKRLHEQYATDPEFVSGFLDEARLAARIRHPNVVPTLDVVATEGQLFLVMEYVDGESLSRLLREVVERGERVPPRIASAIVAGLLHGLHAAHEATSERGEPLDIVHRDVSPQNVMVGVDGVPRVVDFGIAKAIGRLQSTRDGQLKGKLAYMAPEQIEDKPVDRRTDVYAAAVVAWETLTAQRLFPGGNDAATLARVLEGAKKPPSSIAVDAAPLDAIVMCGLARDPDQRWATARLMALAIEDAIPPATATQVGAWVERVARHALAARRARVNEIESGESFDPRLSAMLSEIRRSAAAEGARPPEGQTETDRSLSLSTPARVPSRRRRGPALVFAGALLLLAAGGGIALYAGQRPRAAAVEPPRAPSAPASTPSVVVVPPPPPPQTAPSASAPVAEASTHAARPAPSAVAKPRVDCSTPFWFDSMGRKIYKSECL